MNNSNTTLASAELVQKYGNKANDTGSPEVQIALITQRINYLTLHFQSHKKDYNSKMGLLKMVGKRKRLLEYLKAKSFERYSKLIGALELRK